MSAFDAISATRLVAEVYMSDPPNAVPLGGMVTMTVVVQCEGHELCRIEGFVNVAADGLPDGGWLQLGTAVVSGHAAEVAFKVGAAHLALEDQRVAINAYLDSGGPAYWYEVTVPRAAPATGAFGSAPGRGVG